MLPLGCPHSLAFASSGKGNGFQLTPTFQMVRQAPSM